MDFTCVNCEPYRSRAYVQERRCFREVHPTVRRFVFGPNMESDDDFVALLHVPSSSDCLDQSCGHCD